MKRIDITLAPLTKGDREQFILDNQEAFRFCLMAKHDSCYSVQGEMSREECMLDGQKRLVMSAESGD